MKIEGEKAAQSAAEAFMTNIENLAGILNDGSSSEGEKEKARKLLEGLKTQAEEDLRVAREQEFSGAARKEVHEARREKVDSEKAVSRAINLALGLEEEE